MLHHTVVHQSEVVCDENVSKSENFKTTTRLHKVLQIIVPGSLLQKRVEAEREECQRNREDLNDLNGLWRMTEKKVMKFSEAQKQLLTAIR